MTDVRVLLERHKPRLVYDSHEAYFADSAAIWTDSPTNVLKRAAARGEVELPAGDRDDDIWAGVVVNGVASEGVRAA